MGQKIRNLQHKLGHYRSRVSNKVASTISVLRTRSSDAYSFKTSIGREAAVEDIYPADARARHLHLHNIIVRALLVDEVLYEPGRLLKKSRRAVAVITGADLVLVKMTKATTTASAAASAAAATDSTRACNTGGADASSNGGTAADVAQATVLAQHELNKMVKCEAKGNRLELEFIVTSSARFKVSAAALGFSSSSADSGGLDAAAVAGAVPPSATPCPAAMQVNRIAPASSSSAAAEVERQESHIPGGMFPASDGSLLAGAVAHCSNSSAGAANAANAADATADALVQDQQQQQPTSPVFNGSPAHTCTAFAAADDATASAQAHYSGTSPATGGGSSSFHAWSAQRCRSGSGAGLRQTRSGSYVRQLGSSMVQGASRSVSSSISNFRLVKTDDGDYWVCVESFTLQFRDATMCQLAASLLLSGRSSMRVALEWLKQGLPFSSEFAITHITELSNSRSGDEVLVAGPTPWGTELQLPDSWTDAIRTAQLPDEQPLMTPLEVPDGPAAFNLHLATPAGLAEAILLPEMLALLARQASPQHTAQLLAIPVNLQPAPDSAQGSRPEQPGHAADFEAADAVLQQRNRLQQQQAEQQADAQHVAIWSSKRGAHRSSSSTGNWMSLNASSGSENAASTLPANDAVVSPDEDAEHTEVDTEETLESEAAFDEPEPATADGELTCYDSCTTAGASYQRSLSASSTKGILKTRQQQGSTSMRDGDVAAVDDTAMAAALFSPRHRVGWSPDLTEDADASNAAHQAQGVDGCIYSDNNNNNNNAASSAPPRHQQQQLQERVPRPEQHHQQSHQSQQRVGLRSKATRAAKKLLHRVVTPRRLGRTAADRTYSGPPGSQGRWYGSSSLMYRRSKSSPEGMMEAAAAIAVVAADRSSTPPTAPGSGELKSSVRVHRFGSSGELLPVHAGGMHLADEVMQDAADPASAAVNEVANGVRGTQWRTEAQHQQQQQLRHSSVGSAAWKVSGNASEDSSAPQNSNVLTRSSSSKSFKLKPEDQEEPKLSFLSEMYAVIHVQLVPCSSGSADSSTSSSTVGSSTAAKPTAAGLDSPFAAVASMPGLVGDPSPAVSVPTPSVLVLGNHSGTNHVRLTQQEQQLLSALGLFAGILCGLGMLGLHTVAGRLLILAAALLNAVCLVGSAQPGLVKSAVWRSKRSSILQTTLPLIPSQSIGPVAAEAPGAATTGAFHSVQPQEGAAGLAADQEHPHTAGSPAAAANISSALLEGRLHLRLVGGGYVKEALGLLEEQILAYKSLRERAAAAADAGVLSVAVDSSGDDALLAAADLTVGQQAVLPCDSTDAVVLISSPEPDWMTPDWRRRIFVARPNNEERRKVASVVHTFRTTYGADQMLKQPPPNFDFFQLHLGLKPLLVTPQGFVVVLLKMQTLVQMSHTVAAAGLTISDMVAHCGFLWSFMFEVLAPHNHPGGRIILVADMANIKLGQAVGEGQIGARALGEVCFAWPERLCRCLVLGTPSWFNMLYRMVRPHLSPNTRAKVQVCDVSEGAAELTRCLGPELVPKEYGGTCALSYDDYPAQKQLLQFVAKLQLQKQH